MEAGPLAGPFRNRELRGNQTLVVALPERMGYGKRAPGLARQLPTKAGC